MTATPDDGLGMIDCEHCGKSFPEDEGQNICEDTGLWCDDCADKWKAHFAACQHEWVPHQGEMGPGKYCTKCAGFIEDDAPDAATATQGAEICDPGAVAEVSGVGVAGEALEGALAAPGEWVGNSIIDRASWDIADQMRRHGGTYLTGYPAAMPNHTADALAAMGLVGIYRVVPA